jgi:hypothetical protein
MVGLKSRVLMAPWYSTVLVQETKINILILAPVGLSIMTRNSMHAPARSMRCDVPLIVTPMTVLDVDLFTSDPERGSSLVRSDQFLILSETRTPKDTSTSLSPVRLAK